MKPEHTKPFNFDHAKAGAPYGTKTGAAVEIVKWDMHRNGGPILAIVGEHQEIVAYRRDGISASAADLVMLPVAIVGGKPAFVGDQLQYRSNGEIREVAPKDAAGWFKDEVWTWPKPPKEYPKTRMSQEEIIKMLESEKGDCMTISDSNLFRQWTEIVANGAIARAIEDGDVFTREQVSKVADAVWLHCRAVCPPDSASRRRIMDDVDPEEVIKEALSLK